jgi:hypothetical protein
MHEVPNVCFYACVYVFGGFKISICHKFLCVSPEVLKMHDMKLFTPHIKKVGLIKPHLCDVPYDSQANNLWSYL